MTREFQQMLKLAAIGATGHTVDMSGEDIDWQKVLAAAKRQKVEYLVAYALKRNPQLLCPSEIRDPLLKEARPILNDKGSSIFPCMPQHHRYDIPDIYADKQRHATHDMLFQLKRTVEDQCTVDHHEQRNADCIKHTEIAQNQHIRCKGTRVGCLPDQRIMIQAYTHHRNDLDQIQIGEPLSIFHFPFFFHSLYS